jgi:hypothetical protein
LRKDSDADFPTVSSRPQASATTTRRLGLLSGIAGGALALILIAAPLAYACTRPDPLQILSVAIHALGLFWLIALAIEKRTPQLPSRTLWAAVGLLAFVWVRYIAFDAATPDDFTRLHFARIADRWPESIIGRTPAAMTLLASSLIIALLMAADIGHRSRWRKIFVAAMVGCGLAVVGIGLWQNHAQAPGIYGEIPRRSMPSPFFGTFYHFTSAGAFINLTWPLAASLALGAWIKGLLIGHAAHVSRFPQVIAATVLIGLLVIFRPWNHLRFTRMQWVMGTATCLILVAGALWLVSRTGRLDRIASRWSMVHFRTSDAPITPPPPPAEWPRLMRDDLVIPYQQSNLFQQDRLASYALALDCIKARPLLGFGPGGWMAAASEHSLNPLLRTFYLYLQFTHQDYLQAIIEWGLVGTALWGFLVLGGVWRALARLLREGPQTDPVFIGCAAALAAVLIQSLIDFPLQIPANALYACVLAGLCWSRTRSTRASSAGHPILNPSIP